LVLIGNFCFANKSKIVFSHLGMSCAQVKLTSLQHSFNTLVCSLDLSPDIKMQVVQKQHDATMKTQNKQIFYILEEEM